MDLDQDKSWRYVITRYDPGPPSLTTDVAFLTKHNAPGDYFLENSRATKYLHDAATNQTDGHGPQQDLRGDVIVLGTTRRLTTSLIFRRTLKPKTSNPLGSVFPTHIGTPTDPRNALRAFAAIADRAGLAGVGVHTLRHSAASALIASGAHIKVVHELLGHSSYGITADVYSHVHVDQQREAAERLGEAFPW